MIRDNALIESRICDFRFHRAEFRFLDNETIVKMKSPSNSFEKSPDATLLKPHLLSKRVGALTRVITHFHQQQPPAGESFEGSFL